MAKARINKQDTLGSSTPDADNGLPPTSGDVDVNASDRMRALQDAAVNAPSHPVLISNPAERAKTDAIPASSVGELPGPGGTATIHGNTNGASTRDGDLDPEGWYGGQGGVTGDQSRETVPVSEDMREAKEKRHEKLAGH
jgi:hypothetical protein